MLTTLRAAGCLVLLFPFAGTSAAEDPALPIGPPNITSSGPSLQQQQRIDRSARTLDQLKRRALADSDISMREEQQIRSAARRHQRLKHRFPSE